MLLFLRNARFGIVYAAMGVAFIALSGSAEGLMSPRIIIGFVGLITGFVQSLIGVIALLGAIFFRNITFKTAHVFTMIGFLLLLMAILTGIRIDDQRIEQSKQIGDAIFEKVNAYVESNERCPLSLTEIESFKDAIPKPTIRFSEYRYRQTEDGGCYLEFAAPTFLSCTRRNDEAEWRCND